MYNKKRGRRNPGQSYKMYFEQNREDNFLEPKRYLSRFKMHKEHQIDWPKKKVFIIYNNSNTECLEQVKNIEIHKGKTSSSM